MAVLFGLALAGYRYIPYSGIWNESFPVPDMLQPIDLFVLLKIAVSAEEATYADLADEMGLSSSQVFRAVKRCQKSGLLREDKSRVNTEALLELLIHGVRYVYPPEIGPETRGWPTAHSAEPFRSELVDVSPQYVWSDSAGNMRGASIEPLHKKAAFAAKQDADFHGVLAAVDALRVGRARERDMAASFLARRLSKNAD